MTQFVDYNGYEELARFMPGELHSYRQMLLEKTQPMVDLIGNEVWMPNFTKPGLRVLEIGCGNGRLLIGLANQGLLEHGAGIDISQSRIDFANQWCDDAGHDDKMTFVCDDVLNRLHAYNGVLHGDGGFDLAVCITGCFQYFYPASPQAPRELLRYMKTTAPWGLFELYKRPPMGRTWKELPADDPWMYVLDDYVDNDDWVEHTKTFIARDGRVDTRVENLAYYTPEVFITHLKRAGYTSTRVWEDSSSFVVLAS
jgi:SAM-dependent methyltransferase